MSVKIKYSNKTKNKASSNLVLFTNEKFDIRSLKKDLSNDEFPISKTFLKQAI